MLEIKNDDKNKAAKICMETLYAKIDIIKYRRFFEIEYFLGLSN